MVFRKMATKSKFATKFTVTKLEVDCNLLHQMIQNLKVAPPKSSPQNALSSLVVKDFCFFYHKIN